MTEGLQRSSAQPVLERGHDVCQPRSSRGFVDIPFWTMSTASMATASIEEVCRWKKVDTAKTLSRFKLDRLFEKLGIGALAEDLFGEVPATHLHTGDVRHREPLACNAQGHGVFIVDGSLTVEGAFTFYTADAYTVLVVTGDLHAADLVQAWDTQLVVLGATRLAGLLAVEPSDAGFAVFRGPVTCRHWWARVDVERDVPLFAKPPKGKRLERWTGPTEPAELHLALGRGDSFAPAPAPKGTRKTPGNAALAKMSIAEVLTVRGFEKMMFEGEKVNPNWFAKGAAGCALESLTIGAAYVPAFPAELGTLKELVLLHLTDEERLAQMLRSLPALRSLTRLRIANCALPRLPDEVGALASLEVLELSNNKTLKSVPAGVIGKLDRLRKLTVEGTAMTSAPEGPAFDRIAEVTFDGERQPRRPR